MKRIIKKIALLTASVIACMANPVRAYISYADVYEAPNGSRVTLLGDIHGKDGKAQDRTFCAENMSIIEGFFNSPNHTLVIEGTEWRKKHALKQPENQQSTLQTLMCKAKQANNLKIEDLRDGVILNLVMFYTYNYSQSEKVLRQSVQANLQAYPEYNYTSRDLQKAFEEKIAHVRTLQKSLNREQTKQIDQLVLKLETALHMIKNLAIDHTKSFLQELAEQKISHEQFVKIGDICRETVADVGYVTTIVHANAQKKHVVLFAGTGHCANIEKSLQDIGYKKIDIISADNTPFTRSQMKQALSHLEKECSPCKNVQIPCKSSGWVQMIKKISHFLSKTLYWLIKGRHL